MRKGSSASDGRVGIKRESVAVSTLNALIAPAFAADGDIAVVAADFYLSTLGNYVAMRIDSRIYYSLPAAGASRFNLVDCIGNFKQTARAFEEMRLEVGAQTVANYIAAIFVDHTRELVDLLGCKELSLVDQNPLRQIKRLLKYIFDNGEEISVMVYPAALTLYAYAAAYHILVVTGIDNWFEAEIRHVSLFKIVGCSKKQSGLGAPHSAVTEI